MWLTSPAFITEDLRQGRLRLLDVPDLEPREADIWLATLQGNTRSPALDTLIEITQAWLSSAATADG